MFKDKLQENEARFEKITIKESLLNKATGEVPQEWLRKYNGFMTWQDMSFECVSHCKKSIKSLKGLLDHFDENKVAQHKRALKCHICSKVYADQATNLILYLNHMSRIHSIGHLKFTCILCDKVFVNVVKLTQHMIAEHPERKLRIFPCFDCGLLFSQLDRLKTHKDSHRYTDTESSWRRYFIHLSERDLKPKDVSVKEKAPKKARRKLLKAESYVRKNFHMYWN